MTKVAAGSRQRHAGGGPGPADGLLSLELLLLALRRAGSSLAVPAQTPLPMGRPAAAACPPPLLAVEPPGLM